MEETLKIFKKHEKAEIMMVSIKGFTYMNMGKQLYSGLYTGMGEKEILSSLNERVRNRLEGGKHELHLLEGCTDDKKLCG